MKNINQFRIGIVMCILEYFIFISGCISGKFNHTVFMCAAFWTLWVIYFWNQRGKKCQLKIIPLKKDTIEIGDLVQETGFPLSGITSGITVCMVPGGKDYTNDTAKPIQLVIVSYEKLELGDFYLDNTKDEIKQYSASEILELTALHGTFDDLHAKKVILLQKDLSSKFIQSVIQNKIRDNETVFVRKNKAYIEKQLWKSELIIGGIMLFFCILLGDIISGVYFIFDQKQVIPRAITLAIGIAIIAPIFYHAMRFIMKHFVNKK